MKKIGLIIILLLCINFTLAINLEVKAEPIANTVITELNKPAIFNLKITNKENLNSFEIYSLIGVDIEPKKLISIDEGQTKTILITVLPQQSIQDKTGFFTFEYRIRSVSGEIQKEQLTILIQNLNEVISIIPKPINPKSEVLDVEIKNKANHNLTDIKIKFDSAFIEHEETFSFKGKESKQISIPIIKDKLTGLNAGNFLLNTIITTEKVEVKKELLINFLEQEDIETSEEKEGLIIKRTQITKNNLGNTRKTVEIVYPKKLISSLFTSFNIEPTETKKDNQGSFYIWKKELIPNEKLTIIIKTNWFYPVIIVILIILIVIIIKRNIETDLTLRKNVSYVRTKGGEFALKVSLKIKAKNSIQKINITDRLPPMVKLYDKYGAIQPDKVDLNNRRIEWTLQHLNKGEERIFTYIIYSKIGVVGRFELPEAKVTYEKNNKLKNAISNKSFFVNEPSL